MTHYCYLGQSGLKSRRKLSFYVFGRCCVDYGQLYHIAVSAAGDPKQTPTIALDRKNYLFLGSERGDKSAAIAYTMIETAKLNSVDPQAWLTDTLARVADHKNNRVDELLPWHYA